MMFPASTHMATRRRSPLFGFRVARKSTLQTDDDLRHCYIYLFDIFVFCSFCLGATAGWAISTQATEAISISLRRESTRTMLSLEPRFLRSSQSGASETCSGIRGELFTPSTKLATPSCNNKPQRLCPPTPFHIHYTAFWYLLLLLQY